MWPKCSGRTVACLLACCLCALQYAAAYAAGAVLFKSSDPAYAAKLYAHAKQAFAFAETYKSK